MSASLNPSLATERMVITVVQAPLPVEHIMDEPSDVRMCLTGEATLPEA